jgi:hypothetical protein
MLGTGSDLAYDHIIIDKLGSLGTMLGSSLPVEAFTVPIGRCFNRGIRATDAYIGVICRSTIGNYILEYAFSSLEPPTSSGTPIPRWVLMS